jgi:hypothetical protein
VAVPHELDVLLMAALAKNPGARPRDAFSFAASLRNLKRVADDGQAREATENRVTAAAVLAPDSGPLPSAPLPAGSTGSPKTTLVGMPTPTPAPTLARTAPFAFSTTDDAKDRAAITNTSGPDTVPTPQHGTEALEPEPAALDPVRLAEASTELQWPRDRPPVLSDEPQVQSLPAASSPRRRLGPMALVIVGGAAVATVVIATHRGSRETAAGSPPAALTVAPAVPPPALPPSPTARGTQALVAPAGSETFPAVSASAPASTSTSTSTSSVNTIAPLVKAHAVRVPAAGASGTHRPGPGF